MSNFKSRTYTQNIIFLYIFSEEFDEEASEVARNFIKTDNLFYSLGYNFCPRNSSTCKISPQIVLLSICDTIWPQSVNL